MAYQDFLMQEAWGEDQIQQQLDFKQIIERMRNAQPPAKGKAGFLPNPGKRYNMGGDVQKYRGGEAVPSRQMSDPRLGRRPYGQMLDKIMDERRIQEMELDQMRLKDRRLEDKYWMDYKARTELEQRGTPHKPFESEEARREFLMRRAEEIARGQREHTRRWNLEHGRPEYEGLMPDRGIYETEGTPSY